ncbi:MAG: PAS domain S-box protein [Syntrophaceae bacterium]|nr:PAS domain S-box protein [Syntrophaceae bacterium]
MQNTSPSYKKGLSIIRFLSKISSSWPLDPEENRRAMLAVFFLLTMMIFTLAFSVYHFYNRHYIIVVWDFLGFFLSLLILLYLYKKGKTDIVDWMVGSGLILFGSVTTIIGRAEISIFFWAFVLPIAFFAVVGKKKGLVLSLLYLCINIFLMIAPEQMMHSQPYFPSFIIRFSVIYIIITFATYSYEFSQKTLVTDIQQSEEKYRRSEERYRTILEKIEDGYFEVNLVGKLTFFNNATCVLFGYSPNELMGMHYKRYTDKENARKLFQTFNEVYRTGIGSRILEYEAIRKDGTKRQVEIFASLMKNSEGNVTGFRGIIRDITERRKAEEFLRQSEEKYRTILENMEEGYYEVDLSGKFTFFNDSICQITGYSREELIGMSYRQYADEENSKKVFQKLNKLYKTRGSTAGFDLQMIRKDGAKRYIEASASLTKDSWGNPIGFRGIVRDITERKQVEKGFQRTMESLQKAMGTTVKVLTASETRDPFTAGHQSRTAHLACAIAREMGLPQDKIEGIHLAGIIHDIGKLSIPADILTKPAKLTELEFSLVKGHSQSGYEMLKDVESPWPLAEIVYQHHERMNGSGYPRNLRGTEILLEARIMAVADVVEAMSSPRSYRPALGIEAALAEIRKNKGFLYDDVVADACWKLFKEKGYQLA